jgi:hypothetical protein
MQATRRTTGARRDHDRSVLSGRQLRLANGILCCSRNRERKVRGGRAVKLSFWLSGWCAGFSACWFILGDYGYAICMAVLAVINYVLARFEWEDVADERI